MLGLAARTGRSRPQFGNKLWKHLIDEFSRVLDARMWENAMCLLAQEGCKAQI